MEVGPDTVDESTIQVMYVAPAHDHADPLHKIAVIGIKWATGGGNSQYGEVLYLPPRVGAYLAKMLRLAK